MVYCDPVIIGGSISFGRGSSSIAKTSYAANFFRFIEEAYPNQGHVLHNAAIPASLSKYMSLCVKHHVRKEADLVVVCPETLWINFIWSRPAHTVLQPLQNVNSYDSQQTVHHTPPAPHLISRSLPDRGDSQPAYPFRCHTAAIYLVQTLKALQQVFV